MEPSPDGTGSGEQPDAPWYRRPRNLVGIGVLAAAVIAALILAVVAKNRPATEDNSGSMSSAAQAADGVAVTTLQTIAS